MTGPDELRSRFADIYGRQAQCVAFAPGRVNLIGEHIDYVLGCVMPCATLRGVSVAAIADGGTFRVCSDNFSSSQPTAFSLEDTGLEGAAAFAQAVAYELQAAPCNLLVWGDLPIAAGLSSSAALCVALAAAMLAVTRERPGLPAIELVKLCQQAETVASGTGCGLMDQYASVYGSAGQALLLDIRSLSHELLPLKLNGCRLVVVNSGQPRDLGDSSYNLRRTELAEAFAQLRHRLDYGESFRDYPRERLLDGIATLPPLPRSRLEHVVTEQTRVEQFAQALRSADLQRMGRLLSESHHSLSANYKVSTPEIDILVELLQQEIGVLGARIIGGGFGGSVLALVEEAALPGALEAALRQYRVQTGLGPDWMEVTAGGGARVWLPDGRELAVREWLD